MSTITPTEHVDGVYARNGNDVAARVFLQPIAPPSILGLFGFAGATFIIAAHMAGWYGTATSNAYLWPFAAIFGGVAQFLAGMWGYRARDAVATAMHGMWGSFWIAFGILNLLFSTHVLVEPKPKFPELGFWFIALGAITLMGALAVLIEGNLGVCAVLTSLAAGCGCASAGFIAGSARWTEIAGYVFVVAAALAFYVASAMMLASASGRVILPMGKRAPHANRPGDPLPNPIELAWAEPGIKHGQ
ncbi:MAG TPA: acetate uptake transporter [Gaiellaceae bacterium]